MNTPLSHLQDAQKLTSDAYVDLYRLVLRNDPVTFRFKANNTVTWQGNTYEGMPISFSGEKRNSDGEQNKSALRIVNPYGIFDDALLNNKIDMAVVTRYRLLSAHVDSNVNIYQQRMWRVMKVVEWISGQSVTLELWNMTDGVNFMIPGRMYIPPEFPMVSFD